MNIKKFGKGILMVTLATTMALSTPMAAFAQGTPAMSQEDTKVWDEFIEEIAKVFSSTSKSSQARILQDLNNLGGEGSIFTMLYDSLDKEVKKELGKYNLNIESLGKMVDILGNSNKLKAEHLEADAIKATLEIPANRTRIKNAIEIKDLEVEDVTAKLKQFNKVKGIVASDATSFGFLTVDASNKFTVNKENLNELIVEAKKTAGPSAMLELVTFERVSDLVTKFNTAESVTADMRTDMKKLVKDYGLMVVTPVVPPVVPTPKPDTPSGGGAVTPPADKESAEAEKDITTNLEGLTKEDADVAKVTETILKDINKLNSAGAKKASDAIITNMMDVIKNSKDDANSKKAKDSATKLVEALVSRVTTQKVEVKDGKVNLSNSKVKEQIKDAEEMIAKLTKASKENNIELTRTIKPTLNFDVDKDVKDVAVTIPESLWDAIDGKANVSIKTKGVELVLEHDTFAEKEYTINVKENDGIIDLTTDAKFAKPITVVFQADKEISFPTVYQIIDGKDKLVGGVYNPETKTIAAALQHFSFYKVDAASPEAFEDINELTWEKKAIDELSSRGYLAGMPGNLYAPHESTTRAELAAMLTRVMPVAETTQSAISFTDLKEDAWYYTSIATAVEQGWLVGRDNNEFDPSAPVTRQEVASVLSRVLVQKGYLETSGDAEGVNVADWAKDAVSLFLREIDVEQVTELDMSSPATRAEVAVMIYNTLNK